MGRFWIDDDFVRLRARNLSPYASLVYIALCSAANKEGKTFIGHRKIGEWLGISKNTVTKSLKELEASHQVVRSKRDNGRVSQITILTVPNEAPIPSHIVGPKEGVKELYKEEFLIRENTEYNEAEMQRIRDQLINKGIVKRLGK